MDSMPMNPILAQIKEVYESEDLKEIAAMLGSGEWIGIAAIEVRAGIYRFVLGRVQAD